MAALVESWGCSTGLRRGSAREEEDALERVQTRQRVMAERRRDEGRRESKEEEKEKKKREREGRTKRARETREGGKGCLALHSMTMGLGLGQISGGSRART